MRTATWLTAALLLSCAPAMSNTQNQSAVSEGDEAAAVAEVEQLHAFFVRWFLGSVPESDAAFGRFSSALASEFEMVAPSGAVLGRGAVLEGVRGLYGEWRGDDGAAIEIRNAKPHAIESIGGGLMRVGYEEWQRRDGEWKGRRSSALLRRVGADRFEWVYVHETWIAD